jgi:hypothetical protein
MESPYPFGGAQSRGVRAHTNTPWVAANPPPSSFGDYPAQPMGRVFFQASNLSGEFSAILPRGLNYLGLACFAA